MRGVRSSKSCAAARVMTYPSDPKSANRTRPNEYCPPPPPPQRNCGDERPLQIAPLQLHDVKGPGVLLECFQHQGQVAVEPGIVFEHRHHVRAVRHQVPHGGALAEGIRQRSVRNGMKPHPGAAVAVHKVAVFIRKRSGVSGGPEFVIEADSGKLRRHQPPPFHRPFETDKDNSHWCCNRPGIPGHKNHSPDIATMPGTICRPSAFLHEKDKPIPSSSRRCGHPSIGPFRSRFRTPARRRIRPPPAAPPIVRRACRGRGGCPVEPGGES